MKKYLLHFLVFGVLSANLVSAQNTLINIPADKTTIQEGIDSANDGDTVLVAPGEYFENLNLKGKNILLASHFIIQEDLSFIPRTIINGSRPTHADTASCILIINHESSDCVIAGFTLLEGKGTRWEDEHGPGNFYTEGGGILIQNASPIIRNNIIQNNEAINKSGSLVSAGGGAIRAGDSNPKIINNYISQNKGLYGAGIVLNYSGAIVRNNIIVNNSGGQDFGGGGIWILGNAPDPRYIENNTIVNNIGGKFGGGIRIWNSGGIFTNNIIRGNHANSGKQISGNGEFTYNNVEGGKSGEGNVDIIIRFTDPSFMIPEGNSSIDGGNPHASYFDPEDPDQTGMALHPSQGSTINDQGAYGGPGAQSFPPNDLSFVNHSIMNRYNSIKLYPNPVSDKLTIEIPHTSGGIETKLKVISLAGKTVFQEIINPQNEIITLDLPGILSNPGCYFIQIQNVNQVWTQKMIFREY